MRNLSQQYYFCIMILNVSLEEAARLIKTQTGWSINLRIVNSDTIAVGYEVKINIPILGERSKTIELNLQVEKVENDIVFAQCADEEMGLDLILRGLLTALQSDGKHGLIEITDNSRLKIHLKEIEKLQAVLDKITIHAITFADNSILVDFCLKSF